MSKEHLDEFTKAHEVYRRLKKLDLLRGMRFTSIEAGLGGDIFKIFIATILSQNTNDRNSIDAFNRLEEKVGIDPLRLSDSAIDDIIDAIKPAGLYNSKAKTIKEASKLTVKYFNGDLRLLRRYNLDEARRILTSIDGVGFKTADIVLLHLGYPTFPVDTHIKRVTRRLGLVDEKAGYIEVSTLWAKALKKEDYLDAHLRLIAFGRKICKARQPKCGSCPLKDICSYVRRYG